MRPRLHRRRPLTKALPLQGMGARGHEAVRGSKIQGQADDAMPGARHASPYCGTMGTGDMPRYVRAACGGRGPAGMACEG